MPFIATGGLADVVGSLPKALRSADVDCRVVIPMYSGIPQAIRSQCKYIDKFYVQLGWRNQYCGVFEMVVDGTVFYLLDNEYYFHRHNIYGEFDDAERFCFFSKAILELINCDIIDFVPHIIHCNDWQTAMIPVYLNVFYRQSKNLKYTRTIFTIHNIAYQGRFGLGTASDVACLPNYAVQRVEYDGDFNMMKGGIEEADKITTVSPTYSYEILNPWYSYGLDKILVPRQHKLTGILNGIDYEFNNPKTDKFLEKNYSYLDISGKHECKAMLQQELGLAVIPTIPIVAIVSRLVEMKGIDLFCYILDELMQRDLQVVVLGTGEGKYEDFFRDRANRYAGKMSFRNEFSVELSHKIYAGADIFVMPSKSEPCGLAQMIALRYGTIPIVRETGGLFDSIKDLGGEGGNGFTFKTYNAHDMLDALNRAIAMYENNEDWEKIVKNAMMCDFSWESSADKYIELYKSVL